MSIQGGVNNLRNCHAHLRPPLVAGSVAAGVAVCVLSRATCCTLRCAQHDSKRGADECGDITLVAQHGLPAKECVEESGGRGVSDAT